MTDNLCFLDTETTGLDPDLHEIWEVGAIIDDTEYLWHLPVDLGVADPIALNIGRFHDRYGQSLGGSSFTGLTSFREFCDDFARLTRGKHLVGAVVSFDEERLRRLLRQWNQCPMWHYHLVDVEALAAGFLGMAPPWDSDELATKLGIDRPEDEKHTALGDARWVKAIYEAVMTGRDR